MPWIHAPVRRYTWSAGGNEHDVATQHAGPVRREHHEIRFRPDVSRPIVFIAAEDIKIFSAEGKHGNGFPAVLAEDPDEIPVAIRNLRSGARLPNSDLSGIICGEQPAVESNAKPTVLPFINSPFFHTVAVNCP